jgi:hypothetical protein
MSVQSQNPNQTNRPIKKMAIRAVSLIFLSLLFLEFIIYFGSNIFLSEWAERKINLATKNVYKIDFDRFNFSLLRRGVFLDGFTMTPIPGQNPAKGQALFTFSLDHLSLQNLWYSFSEDVIYIGKIELNNPDAKLQMQLGEKLEVHNQAKLQQNADSELNSPQKSAVKQLEEEIQKSIKRLRFDALFIKEVEINHADLFFFDFLSQNSLKAENTRLHIKNIDWTSQQEWKSPFNASGYEFELENIRFPLPDGVHSLRADKAYVSSIEQVLDLTNFQLQSDKSKESKSYYDVSLQKLKIENIDLNKAFMTSQVEIGELILNEPVFNILKNNKIQKKNVASGDLNELIEGILKSVQINELAINNGTFSKKDFFDSLKNRIDFEGLDFKMINFYLGNDKSKNANQFFYGQDASMQIKDASLYLADQIHVLKGQNVLASSFKNLIQIQNFSILPAEKANTEPKTSSLIELKLPEFTLEGVDLKKLYQEEILEIGVMKLISPQIEYTDIQNPRNKTDFASAAELVKSWVDKVFIGTLEIQDGILQFKEKAGVRSNDIEFEKFSLMLENISIQPGKSIKTWNEFLLAEEIVLSLDTYRLKLRDNLHEFLAEKVLIDSKKSLVEITGFELRPEKPDQIQVVLDSYAKSSAINLKVPKFRLEGIDLLAALVDQELLIKQIVIQNPELSLARYPNKSKTKSEEIQDQLESSKEFEDLLTSYFNVIRIDSVNFTEGKIDFANYGGNKQISLSEDKLTLNLRNFLVQKDKKTERKSTFFSDEIDLNLQNYSFSIADGNYVVETAGLKFNSREKALYIEDFVLNPGPRLNSKLAFSLRMPQVVLVGIDIENFLFQNELILNQFKVVGGEIELEINSDFKNINKDAKSKAAADSEAAIRKAVELLQIKELDLQDSKLTVNYRTGASDLQAIQTDFDLVVRELLLDSTFNRELNDLSEIYTSVNLSLQDFSYTLPDSTHRIEFSQLAFDSRAHETTFSGVRIIPKSKTGNPGFPIFEGSIDQIGIQNNKLKEIQETGILDLTQIRLDHPIIKVFLDSEPKKMAKSKETDFTEAFVNSIRLQDVVVKDGKIEFHDKITGLIPGLAFQKLELDLKELGLELLDDGLDIDVSTILKKELSFSFQDYEQESKDGLNLFSIDKFAFENGDVRMHNLGFKPKIGTYEYARRIGFQTDVISALAQEVLIGSIDLRSLVENQMLVADKLRIDGLDIEIFRDKRIAMAPDLIKKMPQELMSNSFQNVKLDSLLIENGMVTYREFGEKSILPGMIYFDKLEAVFVPFHLTKSTNSLPLAASRFSADARLMGTGGLHLEGELFYQSPYPMDISVKLGAFDLTEVNHFLGRDAFVKILSGSVKEGAWDFRLDEQQAVGEMVFHYDDLKIEMLDSLTLQKGKGILKVYSFLANVMIRKNNPRGIFKKDVSSAIYFERDQSKFVFNAWWKATLSGLKGSVGVGQPKMPKRKEEE